MKYPIHSILTDKSKIGSHYVITGIIGDKYILNTLIYPSINKPFISKFQRSIDAKDLLNFILIGQFNK